MLSKSLLCLTSILFCFAAGEAQQVNAVIQVKWINGLDGRPIQLADVGIEISPGYREVKARTDEHGVATLQVPRDATIYIHNTKRYVACADEAGGFIHNDFRVSQILASGAVQAVAKPNQCRVANAAPVPGQLVVFMRPWKLFEANPL